jgi:hypothetical protein
LELGCGWERGRVLIPIRNQDGGLRGVLRYSPTHERAPKMLAARGTRLGLIPHPAAEPSEWVVLVEGPPSKPVPVRQVPSIADTLDADSCAVGSSRSSSLERSTSREERGKRSTCRQL